MRDPETFDVREQTTPRYLATLVGEDGVTMLPGSVLTTLTLTLYVKSGNGVVTILNGRNKQNVLNQNGVTVYDALQTDAAGHSYNLLFQTVIADMTLVSATLPVEKHWLLFEWTWAAGVKAGKHEVILAVKNLVGVS